MEIYVNLSSKFFLFLRFDITLCLSQPFLTLNKNSLYSYEIYAAKMLKVEKFDIDIVVRQILIWIRTPTKLR